MVSRPEPCFAVDPVKACCTRFENTTRCSTAAEGETARPLPVTQPRRRAHAPRVVAALGQPFSHTRVRDVGQDRAQESRADPGGGGTESLELETRGVEFQDPTHQPPRLRTPLGRGRHRHNLPLLRRAQDRTTHGESRSMIGNNPHKLEENRN